MSDRRENIKKSLGISEYPWSSEDEEEITRPYPDMNIRRYGMMRQQQPAHQPPLPLPPPPPPPPSQPMPPYSGLNPVPPPPPPPSSQPMPPYSGLNSTPPPTGQDQIPAAMAATASTRPHLLRADGRLYWTINSGRMQSLLSRVPTSSGANPAESQRAEPRQRAEPGQRAEPPRESRAASLGHRRPDTLLRRISPLREIRGILALKKAAANRRPRTYFPSLSALYNAGFPRNASQMLPTRNPIFSPRSATATLEANLRAGRLRRAHERLARDHGLAIPASSGLDPGEGGSASPGLGRGGDVFHTAPSPTRAGDHGGRGHGDQILRTLARPDPDSYVQVASPEMEDEPSERDPPAPAPAGSPLGPAHMSPDESVDAEVEVETAAEATEEPGADDRPDDEDAKSTCVEPATSCIEEPCGVKRKRDSKEDTVTELNQCLLRLLECPVCMEWMEPPMSQCRRGHLVCVSCRSRLASCPVCRTAFSSVRNRAMEGVAEILRYPCRHGCGREVRLRRRAAHEASCARRRYLCPAPACAHRDPIAHHELAQHFQSNHVTMLRVGRKQRFTVKVNAEQHEHWLVLAMHQVFHLRIDVDIRTWGVAIYAAYIGPKNTSKTYSYEVTVLGNHSARKLVYARATHSDLESPSVNASRQDCFYLSLDQALNFLRRKNRDCDADNTLSIHVELSKNEVVVDMDSSGES